MKYLSSSLLLLVLIFSACNSKTDVNYCTEIDPVDKEMLDLYNQILEERKADNKFLKDFKMLHVNWVQYRNSLARTIWYKEPEEYQGDYRNCKCELLMEMTRARIAELEMWTKGNPKWKECEGSVN